LSGHGDIIETQTTHKVCPPKSFKGNSDRSLPNSSIFRATEAKSDNECDISTKLTYLFN